MLKRQFKGRRLLIKQECQQTNLKHQQIILIILKSTQFMMKINTQFIKCHQIIFTNKASYFKQKRNNKYNTSSNHFILSQQGTLNNQTTHKTEDPEMF